MGVALVGLNLRPVVSSLGPVLAEVRADLGLSGTVAGLVTTLPLFCFGIGGICAPPLAARLGVHKLAMVAMTALTCGLAARALGGSATLFVLASTVALLGSGAANVALPTLVKLHFPHQIGLGIGIYSMLMQISTAGAAAVSVPVAHTFGGWRDSLGIWAVTGALAVLPWFGMLAEPAKLKQKAHRVTAWQLTRSRTAWLLTAYFALQSANGYAQLGWLPAILHDAGVGAAEAGFALAMIPAVAILVSALLALITARVHTFLPLVIVLLGCYAVGYLGLLIAPAAAPWLWAFLLGIGNGVFTLGLVLIGLRARTGQGSSALSGFVQGVGYLTAAVGPFTVAALHDATGSWAPSLVLLLASTGVMFVLGFSITKVRYVEDEIR